MMCIMKLLYRWSILFYFARLLLSHFCSASDDEYRLLKDLRENYNPMERPVQNHSEPVNVSLRILLQQIVDMDEKNQVLTLVLWMQLTWVDWKMMWSPEEYGGIRYIKFPYDALWKPDILLFNSADEKFDARFPYGSWTYTGNELDLFIDDKNLKVGHQIDIEYYVHNGEWELVATPAKKIVVPFDDGSYVELYFFLHLRRKTIYYGMNWILPSFLFLLLNVLGFSMPSECGEKITLQTTNLLSVTVFLGMVADVTPPTSTSVPIIAAFFSISMITLGSSIILTLLIINVHFRSPRTHKMSPWVRTVFLEWLPWLLLMNRPGRQFKRPKRSFKLKSRSTTSSSSYSLRRIQQLSSMRHKESLAFTTRSVSTTAVALLAAQRARDGAERIASTPTHSQPSWPVAFQLPGVGEKPPAVPYTPGAVEERQPLGNTHHHGGSRTRYSTRAVKHEAVEMMSNFEDLPTMAVVRTTLRELSEHLRLSQQKMYEEEEEEEAKADWRFMGLALDRACLFFYSFLTAIIPIWIFMSTPHPATLPTVLRGNSTTLNAAGSTA